MPRQQSAGEYSDIFCHGPKAEYVPAELISQIPASINASTTFTSTVIKADGYYDLVFGVTLSQGGNLSVQRYIDDNGLVALDSGQTQALTAATPAVLIITDGKPFGSYKLSIQNTGGSAATPSNFAALTSAH